MTEEDIKTKKNLIENDRDETRGDEAASSSDYTMKSLNHSLRDIFVNCLRHSMR
jgi:hypothetical protein